MKSYTAAELNRLAAEEKKNHFQVNREVARVHDCVVANAKNGNKKGRVLIHPPNRDMDTDDQADLVIGVVQQVRTLFPDCEIQVNFEDTPLGYGKISKIATVAVSW